MNFIQLQEKMDLGSSNIRIASDELKYMPPPPYFLIQSPCFLKGQSTKDPDHFSSPQGCHFLNWGEAEPLKNFHMIFRVITEEERLNYNVYQRDVLAVKN